MRTEKTETVNKREMKEIGSTTLVKKIKNSEGNEREGVQDCHTVFPASFPGSSCVCTGLPLSGYAGKAILYKWRSSYRQTHSYKTPEGNIYIN